jgi:hypothetical protein
MKTHVIQLDRHDDVTSVTDKITWSKSNRILLVWPKRGVVMNRALDLLLIQRACAGLGADLACVAEDNDILDHAKDLGIPVFRSAKVAQRLPWRRQRHKKVFEPRELLPFDEIEKKRLAVQSERLPWTGTPWVRWASFILGLAAVFVFVLILAPAARIELQFSAQPHEVELPVWASPELKSVNLSGGIPATEIKVVIEGQDSIETTGFMSVPQQAASGTVEFSNLTNHFVTIPAGTIVQTVKEPLIQFRTNQDITLVDKPGAANQGQVTAVQAGSQGNTGAETIKAVVGTFGTQVAVHNPQAITGGHDLTSQTTAKADIDTLRSRLIESLKENALKELQGKLEPGSRLLPQTLIMSKIQTEKQDPVMGLPGDKVNLTLQVEYTAWSIREEDMATIGHTALESSLPQGMTALSASFQDEDFSQPVLKDGQLHWQIRASELIQATWDSQTIIRAAAGKGIEQARRSLSELPGLAGTPVITMAPGWWPILPLLPGRIQVEIK